MIWANKFFLQEKTRSRVRWIEGRWCWLMGLQIMWGNLVTLSSTGCPSPYFTIVLISRPTTFSSLLPEALIKSFTTCQFFWVTQLNVNINLLPVILFFFDVTFLDPTICEWQQFTRMKGIYHLPSKFSLTSCAITKRLKTWLKCWIRSREKQQKVGTVFQKSTLVSHCISRLSRLRSTANLNLLGWMENPAL